jgi:hypothetical protein
MQLTEKRLCILPGMRARLDCPLGRHNNEKEAFFVHLVLLIVLILVFGVGGGVFGPRVSRGLWPAARDRARRLWPGTSRCQRRPVRMTSTSAMVATTTSTSVIALLIGAARDRGDDEKDRRERPDGHRAPSNGQNSPSIPASQES